MDDEIEKHEIYYPDSNRLGKFLLLRETLRSGAARPWLQALFALTGPPIEQNPHESGRGVEFLCACEMFQPLAEGEEIPEYRIECELVRPFTPEENAKAFISGRFKFYAVRKIIVRVPTATLGTHGQAASFEAPGRIPPQLH